MSEQREIAKKGGEASARARNEKRRLRKLIELALQVPEGNKAVIAMMHENGWQDDDITQAAVIVQGLIMKAKQGDVSAFNAIRDLIGEKPVDEVSNTLSTQIEIGFVETGKELASDEDEIDM